MTFAALPMAKKRPRNDRYMVKITGEYQGDLHCVATHGPSSSQLVTDAPVDNQGRGEAFSPTDLVATAIGTCVATTMAIAARRHGVELRGLKFEVTKEMSADAPRRISRLTTHLWMPLPRASAPADLLEKAAHACPVHQSLHPSVEKPVVFHWPA
ncbi:MAG TPA: OsmC family protein [Opitutaceae bacterium]|nr:OsmC family protein [Opitutaceae bacterium]